MSIGSELIKLVKRASTVFIIAFMIMLISAAVALALGSEVLANKLAEVAYYFLVIGVVAQLVNLMVKERKKGGK